MATLFDTWVLQIALPLGAIIKLNQGLYVSDMALMFTYQDEYLIRENIRYIGKNKLTTKDITVYNKCLVPTKK